MARNYTREQQRRYREERRAQAARVADRLLGKRKDMAYSVWARRFPEFAAAVWEEYEGTMVQESPHGVDR